MPNAFKAFDLGVTNDRPCSVSVPLACSNVLMISVVSIHLIDPYLCVEDKRKYKQDVYAILTHCYTSPVNHFNTHALHLNCLKGVGGENF